MTLQDDILTELEGREFNVNELAILLNTRTENIYTALQKLYSKWNLVKKRKKEGILYYSRVEKGDKEDRGV